MILYCGARIEKRPGGRNTGRFQFLVGYAGSDQANTQIGRHANAVCAGVCGADTDISQQVCVHFCQLFVSRRCNNAFDEVYE